MILIEEIEDQIKNILLTEVSFILESKKIKTGKLILFTMRSFFCVFTLFDQLKNKKTIYEIPCPFDMKKIGDDIEFDYTTDTFAKRCAGMEKLINSVNLKTASKLFNKKLLITSSI